MNPYLRAWKQAHPGKMAEYQPWAVWVFEAWEAQW